MRILLTTIGSSGDINPFVAVGRSLVERGHEVLMLVNPHYEPRVRAAGMAFHPLGSADDLTRALLDGRLVSAVRGPFFVIRELITTALPQTVEAMEHLIATFKPDVVLRHHISFGARWVCQRHGVPDVTGVLTPLFWFSRLNPGVYHPLPIRRQPREVGRVCLMWGTVGMRWIVDPPLNRVARRLGFPPTRDFLITEALDATLTLGLWSTHFRGPAPDDPPHGRICGFPWFDRQHADEHPPHEIEAFLDEDPGDPPIVFTLGTSNVHHAGQFYRRAAAACRILGRRGILLTGKPEYAPPARDLPAGVRAFTYAPFSTLLPRAAATVHHGGIGTTAQALRAGKPTLILPTANDQFDNALRVVSLGVGDAARTTLLTPHRLARRLRTLLDDPATLARAADLGRKLQAEDGAPAAAEAIEHLHLTRRPSNPTDTARTDPELDAYPSRAP